MSNERPDWREYWPIRRHLLNEPLVAGDFYGFFSPRFRAKTGLGSNTVFDFIRRNADASDVFLFSPFFDQSACNLNIFEQGALHGIINTFRECISKIAPQVDFDALVMDSRTTVFCNFFVAKPKFWLEWLALCEIIFAIAEAGDTDLGKSLNSETDHRGGHAPAKVFVIERIASLMLSSQEGWQPSRSSPWRCHDRMPKLQDSASNS